MRRLTRWGAAGTRFAIMVITDTLRGRRGPEAWGVRLRELFEAVGGTAIKVGQQLATRVDMLPFEVCTTLGTLMEDVPPFPVGYAIERVEAITGAPLHQTFRRLDPVPIGSASVACVFQGELVDGTHVAVKVQRHDVAALFGADLQCMNWITKAAEALTFVRDGLFDNLRQALQEMFLEELDFVQEARYQRLFRKATKRDRMHWVTAPRVFTRLSGPDVLVTEFVKGIPCTEVIGAADTGDPAMLDLLRAQDIEPREVGRRLLHLVSWSKYERSFFHSDPHPGNLFVLPQGKIVMIDFGACGITTTESKDLQLKMMKGLIDKNAQRMASASIALLAPVPHVDIEDLHLKFQRSFNPFVLASEDPESEWWERTSAPLWLKFMAISREGSVPVNLDAVRMVRSTLLYETVATRLDPDLGVKEFKRYLRRAQRRSARNARRELSKQGTREALRASAGATSRLLEQLQESASVLSLLEHPFLELQRLMDRGAYLVREILRLVVVVAALLGGAILVRLASSGAPYQTMATARAVVTSPAVIVVLALVLVVTVRRMHMRLTDID